MKEKFNTNTLVYAVFVVVFASSLVLGAYYFIQTQELGEATTSNNEMVFEDGKTEGVYESVLNQIENPDITKYHVAVFDEGGNPIRTIKLTESGLVKTVDDPEYDVEYQKGTDYYMEGEEDDLWLVRVQGTVDSIDIQNNIVVVRGDTQKRFIYLSDLIPTVEERITNSGVTNAVPKREEREIRFDDIQAGDQISVNTSRLHGSPGGPTFITIYENSL